MFRYLTIIQGFMAPKDREIRLRILKSMEQDLNATLQRITEVCQRSLNL